MDAGTAAVLGATVAAVGPVATAIVSRKSAYRQGQVDHGLWLRDQRHQVYVDALEAGRTFKRRMNEVGDQRDDATWLEVFDRAAASREQLEAVLGRVVIAGPKDVTDWAQILLKEALEYQRVLRSAGLAPDDEAMKSINRVELQFEAYSESFTNALRHANETPPWETRDPSDFKRGLMLIRLVLTPARWR